MIHRRYQNCSLNHSWWNRCLKSCLKSHNWDNYFQDHSWMGDYCGHNLYCDHDSKSGCFYNHGQLNNQIDLENPKTQKIDQILNNPGS